MKLVIYIATGVLAALLAFERMYIPALLVIVGGAVLAYLWDRAREWHRSGKP